MHLLLAGLTTRALAVSAARAGHRVTAVDAFGDEDLRVAAEVPALTRAAGRFEPLAAARAVRDIPADAAAYTSNFENYPEAVALLARGRALLGNAPDVLRRVRQPLDLMRTLAARGFAVPRTRASAPPRPAAPGSWLLKPRRSGGGRGVSPWRGEAVTRRRYLQERIRGTAGSIVFLADGRRAWPLGLSRQLTGEMVFGARGFGYCGSLLGGGGTPLFAREPVLREAAEALASAVVEAYGLVGLNGIDFVARDGVPYPLEVNPRVCASMELVERFGGPLLFPLHAAACGGALPAAPMAWQARGVVGKAVVFARRGITVHRLGEPSIELADLPRPGQRIERGHPICTVFAAAPDASRCVRLLADRARRIYQRLEPRARGAA